MKHKFNIGSIKIERNSIRSNRNSMTDKSFNLYNITPQKPLKQVITSLYDLFLVDDPNECSLYESWDELKEAETLQEGKLNWNAIKKIIGNTKKKNK